jgi:hypothetical protein
MDEDGPIYSGARARLVGQLDMAEADVNWLLREVRELFELDAVPGNATLEAIGERRDALVGRVPHLWEPLRDSSELFEEAAAKVDELRSDIDEAGERAENIDRSARRREVPAMQSAARTTADSLERVRKAIYDLVLAYRLKCQLHGLRVGQSVDFKADYKDELPSIDDRIAILNQFKRRSDYFPEAVFDVPGERVWRRSSSAAWRAVTCLALPVFAVLVGAALAGASLLPLEEWHLDDAGDVLAAYGLVLAGVLVHLVVENIKQAQANTVPIIAIGETIDWLHLRWAGLLWSLAPVVVVVVGLLAIGTEVSGEEALVFFFGGYSVDSVAGTFLTRFGTAAGAGVSDVVRRVGGSGT